MSQIYWIIRFVLASSVCAYFIVVPAVLLRKMMAGRIFVRQPSSHAKCKVSRKFCVCYVDDFRLDINFFYIHMVLLQK